MAMNSTDTPFILSCIRHLQLASNKNEVLAEIALVVINIIFCLLGTAANSLVIIAYCRNSHLRTIQNMLFLLLAFTDIGVTSFAQPAFAAAMLSDLLGKRDCLVWNITIILSWLFIGLSLVTIAVLTLQTYITLAYPYRFQSIITKTRLIILVVVFWFVIAAPLLKTLILRHLALTNYICFGVILLPTIFVIFTWLWIHKLVSRHRRVIETSQTPTGPNFETRQTVLRSTITALFVTLSLFGCCCPTIVFMLSEMISTWRVDQNIYLTLHQVSWTLMYLNSLLNPCLVFWRSSNFWKAARNIVSLTD